MSGSMITLFGGGTQVNAPGNQQTPDQIGPLTNHSAALDLVQDNLVALQRIFRVTTSTHPHSALCLRTEIRFGTTGRNIIRGPGFFNLDGSIFRNFKITERCKFQFRMEMFGVTNTPHLNNPGTDVTNPATLRRYHFDVESRRTRNRKWWRTTGLVRSKGDILIEPSMPDSGTAPME